MVEIFSIILVLAFVFLVPGFLLFSAYRRVLGRQVGNGFGCSEIFVSSMALNIIFIYLIFVFAIGSPLLVSVYILIMTLLAALTLFSPSAHPRVSISLVAAVSVLTLCWRVLPDIGLPIMSWDALQVWRAMADAMLQGEARLRTASYPHGLGALGAVAMSAGSAVDDFLALRTLTVFMPLVALAAVLGYWRGARQALAGSFSVLFIVTLMSGLDGISYKYSTSFTSDMFLFATTVIVFFSAFKFAKGYQESNWKWSILWSPSYIIAVFAIFVVANAKQTGLSYIVLPGLIAMVFAPRGQTWIARLRYGAILSVAPTVLGLVWYAFATIREVGASGGASLEFLLVGVHQGRGLVQRAHLAVSHMASLLPLWLWSVCAILSVLGVVTRRGFITLIATMPTVLFYLFVSGYAVRNSTGVVAAILILSLLGLINVFERVSSWSGWPRSTNQKALNRWDGLKTTFDVRAFAGAIALMVTVFAVTNGGQVSRFLEDQHYLGGINIGFRGINVRLDRNSPNIEGYSMLMATNYVVADRIPQLERFRFANRVSYSIPNLQSAIANESDTFVLFILWPDRAPEMYQDFLRCLIEQPGVEDLGTVWSGQGTQYVHLAVPVGEVNACDVQVGR